MDIKIVPFFEKQGKNMQKLIDTRQQA